MEIKRVSVANMVQKRNPSRHESSLNYLTLNSNLNNRKIAKIPYNSAYAIAFMGRSDYSENEQNFVNLRRKIAINEHRLSKEFNIADWDYYTNSTDENEKKSAEAYSKFLEVHNNKNDFERLKLIKEKGISSPELLKSFNDIYPDYEENFTHMQELKKLNDQTLEVQSIINNYRGNIDGKAYTNGKLDDMLCVEKDPQIREKIYTARKVDNGNLLAPKLIELVNFRNNYAKKLGYDDYFSYKLDREFKISEKELFNLVSEVYEKTSNTYNAISDNTNKKLATIFNTNADKLQPWHYNLLLNEDPTKEIDHYFKNTEDVMTSAFSLYRNMGWDIHKLPITLDLLPREGKNQHAYSFDIDKNKDARILANLRPELDSHRCLMHELGHSVYDLSIPGTLHYFDQNVASSSMTEAFAMMNETLAIREANLSKSLEVPPELFNKLEINRVNKSLNFIRSCLHFITFEKEMYANPNQNLAELWYKNQQKYLNRPMPAKLDNRWASEKIHIISYPAYYQNYFRAEIMASQMYEGAKNKLGDLTKTTKTKEFFDKNLFRFGSTLSENEVLQKLSGKSLSVDDYCKQLGVLIKNIK